MIRNDLVEVSIDLSFEAEYIEEYQKLYSYMGYNEIENVLNKMIADDIKSKFKALRFMQNLEIHEVNVSFELDTDYMDEMKEEFSE